MGCNNDRYSTLFENIRTLIQEFNSVSLEDIETVKLMNRIDIKFMMRIEDAYDLLSGIKDYYSVLQIESQRIGYYHSVYYDTEDLRMFHDHVTGRYPRYKVRERCYSQNNQKFFEIKHKENNGRTSKKRVRIDKAIPQPLDGFVGNQTPFNMTDLKPILTNQFDRVTLVNKERTERVTLDFNLHFCTEQGDVTPVYLDVVILEIKQGKRSKSVLRDMLRKKNIRISGMSKYCIGLLLLQKDLKYKKYKPIFTHFIKLHDGKSD